MKSLTSYIPAKYRSVVRFVLVGTICTGIHFGVYYLLLDVFQRNWPDIGILTSVAFALGYFVEMIISYLLTSYYTFKTRPTLKNASGFVLGRMMNFIIQLVLLNLLGLMQISDGWAGIIAILLAGVLNYFVIRLFYKKKK